MCGDWSQWWKREDTSHDLPLTVSFIGVIVMLILLCDHRGARRLQHGRRGLSARVPADCCQGESFAPRAGILHLHDCHGISWPRPEAPKPCRVSSWCHVAPGNVHAHGLGADEWVDFLVQGPATDLNEPLGQFVRMGIGVGCME